MKQTHRRTTMQKRDLNDAALQLYWNHTHTRMHPQKSVAHLQNTLLQENTTASLC